MRIRPVLGILTLIAAGAVILPASADGKAALDAGRQPTAVGTGGAVASADLDASRAGVQVLRPAGTRSMRRSRWRARSA